MNESSPNEPSRDASANTLAGRDVPVDDSPLPVGPATVSTVAMLWRGPDRLVLRVPFWFMILPVLPLAALFASWFLSDAMPFDATTVAVVLLTFGPGMAGYGWICYRYFLLPRVTFDKQAGLLTLGWRGRRGRRPLSSIIGVQVMITRVRSAASSAPRIRSR